MLFILNNFRIPNFFTYHENLLTKIKVLDQKRAVKLKVF